MLLFWVSLVVLVNGVISFAYSVSVSDEPTTLWAMLATTYCVYLGLTQTGIIFSTIMRIAKSKWARYFSRFGEILTLSFIPVAFITFIVIYAGGTEHLFYWAGGAAAHGGEAGAHGGHLSPWLDKNLFLWRTIISMAVFYFVSYVYFALTLKEEREGRIYDSRYNFLAGIVMVFYVITNTNTAWDFGMMIIQHWESSIFPGYYWVGNILAGIAFLFIIGSYFVQERTKKKLSMEYTGYMGVMLMGFVLTWIYMFWSQHIVFWYGDLPNLDWPAKKVMTEYAWYFWLMLGGMFIVPFFALIFRKIKLCLTALKVVAAIIVIGLWLNRYLMIIPFFSHDGSPVFFSWTGVSLILGGLAATIFPVLIFFKLFPKVSISTYEEHGGH
ncbi:MAG: hypothetical protein ACE5GY_07800 [Thermodesulfobacteriota bacterium]